MKTLDEGAVERGLGGLRQRLRSLYAVHGLGTLLGFLSGAALLSYGLDRAFHLPQTLRLLGLAGWAGAVGVLAFRRLVVPLRKRFGLSDLALAWERRFPELREKIVSAVEFPPGERLGSPELVAELKRQAAESLENLPVRSVLNSKRPARMLALGLGGTALSLGVFVADPEAASTWLRRFLGEDLPWPQRTFLDIQISSSEGNLRVERRGAKIRVEMARGTDLPVRVLARGAVPDAVTLHLLGGKTGTMLRTGGREFAHLFAAVREPFAFWATGGDDEDEDPRAEVTPMQPPDLARIWVTLRPPSYSGLPALTREGGAVEALMGTAAEILLESASPVARGQVRFQQSGNSFPLVPAAEPNRFRLSFEVQSNDRYTVELFDEKGLRNPESGSYPVIALPDRKPEIGILSPSRIDFDATAKARIPIRAEVTDDFGVTAARLSVKVGKEGEVREVSLFEPKRGEGPSAENAPADSRRVFLDSGMEVQELRVGDRTPHEGEILYFRLRATDNRVPENNGSESNEFRIILVTDEELERRIHDLLSRVKEMTEALEGLQRDKMDRVNDLLVVLEAEGKLSAAEFGSLRNSIVGQNRVVSSAKNVAHQLFEAFEIALYNRFARESNAWIQEFETARRLAREGAAGSGTAHGDPGAGENLAAVESLLRAYRAGKLGVADFLGKLAEMAGNGLRLAERTAKEAASALDRAALAAAPEEQRRQILLARDLQKEALGGIEKLLTALSEWDNYQTVVNLARELIERQRSINSRTKEMSRQR